MNKLYRSKLVLLNRGLVAQKIKVKLPSIFYDSIDIGNGEITKVSVLQFHPKLGFVQGNNGHFELQVKLRATENFLNRCKDNGYCINNTNKNMCSPFGFP